jgi:hypothetical protein
MLGAIVQRNDWGHDSHSRHDPDEESQPHTTQDAGLLDMARSNWRADDKTPAINSLG